MSDPKQDICPYCEDMCNDLGGGNCSKSWNGCTKQDGKPCKDKYTGIEDGIGFRDCITYQEAQEDEFVDYGVEKERKRIIEIIKSKIQVCREQGNATSDIVADMYEVLLNKIIEPKQ